MKIPDVAIDLIKRHESCRLTAYRDTGGVLTIGWGTTLGVTPGLTITQAQADEWFARDLEWFATGVQRLVKVPITSNQFGALVSLAYNIGLGAFAKSTLLRWLNAGNYGHARDEFARWVNDGGQRLAGLVKRRAAEVELWDA